MCRLLERIHAMDLEMELHIENVAQILESNNSALKNSAEQLRSSQGMIKYLKGVILTKDLEIERLKNAVDSQKQNTTMTQQTGEDIITSTAV